MSLRKANIVIAATTYMQVWAPAVESWMRAAVFGDRYLQQHGMGRILGVGLTQRLYVHAADNGLVRDFLNTPDATHMLHLEADMIIPDHTIEKLLEIDKPIVSGIYFLRNGNGQPCLYKKSISLKGLNPYGQSPVSLFPENRPFQINGCTGLGCLLIKRDVFEAMEPPWFQLRDGADGYGSDMYFFHHAHKAGIEIWVHPGVACGQIDYTVVGIEDYHRRLKEDPHFAQSGFIVGMHEDPTA